MGGFEAWFLDQAELLLKYYPVLIRGLILIFVKLGRGYCMSGSLIGVVFFKM